MKENTFNEITLTIQAFQASIKLQLPVLESEVNDLIAQKVKHGRTIEHCLDALLSLTMLGMADNLFIRLLEYYKTVDADGALWYWEEYDEGER